jgi:hypothetical protein
MHINNLACSLKAFTVGIDFPGLCSFKFNNKTVVYSSCQHDNTVWIFVPCDTFQNCSKSLSSPWKIIVSFLCTEYLSLVVVHRGGMLLGWAAETVFPWQMLDCLSVKDYIWIKILSACLLPTLTFLWNVPFMIIDHVFKQTWTLGRHHSPFITKQMKYCM